ncbi:hypothetical protein Tco_1082875 [Tanacetum coccineum]|uniref:Uncharacterized protein n=1 Tax=Tanacetum coccineum TaxID=301880 RepID=A0ABQ5I1R3_9ASTR
MSPGNVALGFIWHQTRYFKAETVAGDDRPPPHQYYTGCGVAWATEHPKTQFGWAGSEAATYPPGTPKPRVIKAITNKVPLTIRFEFRRQRGVRTPDASREHAAQLGQLPWDLDRECPCKPPILAASARRRRRLGSMQGLGPRFDMRPHKQDVNPIAGPLSMLPPASIYKRSYNGKRPALKKSTVFLTRTMETSATKSTRRVISTIPSSDTSVKRRISLNPECTKF